MLETPIIDAHHHFWNPRENYHPWLSDEPPIPFRYGDYSAIRGPYMPPEYFRDAGALNVTKTVYVETEWDARDPIGELDWVEKVHAEFGHPGAVVAQAWLDREDAKEVLTEAASRVLVRSVRHKPAAVGSADEARRDAPGSMDDPRWRDGFALLSGLGLMFDLQTPWWHLDAAFALAADFPGTTIVLNHTGLPSDRSSIALEHWRAAMARLSDAGNVNVKISGIGVPGQAWTADANRYVVRETIAMFGVERCMFASNFPVDSLCATFQDIFNGFGEIVSDLPEAEQRALFHDNAERIYRPV